MIKQLVNRLLSYFPSKLPVGVQEFNKFADEVIALSGEFANRDSMRFALASMIIHAESGRGSLPKNYFVVRLRKSAANQVASQIFQEIKALQEAAIKAEAEAAKLAEDTAKLAGSSCPPNTTN